MCGFCKRISFVAYIGLLSYVSPRPVFVLFPCPASQPAFTEMEPMWVGPNLRHRVQLRSFNPTMFTIFDTTNHHRASLTSRTPALVAQDIVSHEFRSSRVAAGGRPLIIEEPPPLHNGRKQYLSSKQQQQHHNQWKAPFKSRSCWCKLCFDSRQNSINHESLLAPPPLVNDREKARPSFRPSTTTETTLIPP